MPTPFDDVIAGVIERRYHNHRLEDHSDIVSNRIYADLLLFCPKLAEDVEAGVVRHWLNVPAPGVRNRKIDLFIGESDANGKPDIRGLRICVENKSVITAHRNRDARFDDLDETMKAVYNARPEAVIAATVMIGTDVRNLNIPDKIKAYYVGRGIEKEFERDVLPRLSTGDQTLWEEFRYAISRNSVADPMKTLTKLRGITTRPPGHTHVAGYDFMIFVPVSMDNVNPPRVVRENILDVDVDAEYAMMIDAICRAYRVRWHP
jgi:hypothetical protein